MTLLEAVNKRTSIRTYLDTPIDSQKIKILEEKILDSNEKSNLSIEFIADGSIAFRSIKKTYGLFKNIKSLILLKGKENDNHLLEKCGYYGELLVLEATNLDLGTCWIGGTFDKSVLSKNSDEVIVAAIAIGSFQNKKSLKDSILKSLISGNKKTVEEFFTSDTDVPEWFLNGIDLVQKAPSAKNTQKVRFEYKNNEVLVSIPDNYPMDLIDLGIAKLHFEIASNRKFPLGNNVILDKNI